MTDPLLFVLVSGWPGSGKSTLARSLATQLNLPLIAKDEIKEALCEAMGPPADVEASRVLGRGSVLAMLRVASASPGAVLDSTWFDYALPLVRALPGTLVQIRCLVPAAVAGERYRERMADRSPAHLDAQRTPDELWGAPVPDLGVGPFLDVDTTHPVDVANVVASIRQLAP